MVKNSIGVSENKIYSEFAEQITKERSIAHSHGFIDGKKATLQALYTLFDRYVGKELSDMEQRGLDEAKKDYSECPGEDNGNALGNDEAKKKI